MRRKDNNRIKTSGYKIQDIASQDQQIAGIFNL
jgi:hypothetical protein